MKQKRTKPRYNAQFKTFNSEQSCIDIFSKIESLFLEKFFRYNLSDYFNDWFINVEEELLQKKVKNKKVKQLASEAYLTRAPISISQFATRVNAFYCSKIQNIEEYEVPFSFKHIFGSSRAGEQIQQYQIREGELVMVQVKMRADVDKLENLPLMFYSQLEQIEKQEENDSETKEFVKLIKKYNSKVLHLFFVYFGDINISAAGRGNYERRKILFLGREVEVNINVFYISRLYLIEYFKVLNKIEHLEYINDLLIQLYEFKRSKRQKKQKNQKNKKDPMQQYYHWLRLIKWITIIGLSTFTLHRIARRLFF